jgi:hypothetical protein
MSLSAPNAHVGNIDGFSFPLLQNNTKQPVTITGYRIAGVPAGIEVLGYSVFSVDDTPGYLMGYSYKPAQHTPDLSKYPDYSGKPITINAGQTSDRYIMAKVEITGTVVGSLTGCQLNYTQGSQAYTQTIDCTYGFNG